MIATIHYPPNKWGCGIPREHWPLMKCVKCGKMMMRHPEAKKCLGCKGGLVRVDREE